jgi:nucleolar protein 4
MAEVKQDVKHNRRTVFVRNIPFSVGSNELEELFTDVGPVRSAFVVQHKGSDNHAGYGFVQYALPEDADRAVEVFQTKRVQGRLLQVRACCTLQG